MFAASTLDLDLNYKKLREDTGKIQTQRARELC